MQQLRKVMVTAALMAVGLAGAASAATPLATNTSVNSGTFSGNLGHPLTVGINLLGFVTLDGQNNYEDDFIVTLKDVTSGTPTQLLVGTYNLGGGGANATYFNVGAVSYTGLNTDPVYNAPTNGGNGGSININLATGLNLNPSDTYQLNFAYNSLTGAIGDSYNSYAGFQGLRDEGWAIGSYSVPEPATWMMMLVGFGGLGAALRMRRRTAGAAVAA
jgi:hypothetical protein